MNKPKVTVTADYNMIQIDFEPHHDKWFFPNDNKRSFFAMLNNKVLRRYVGQMISRDLPKEIECAINREIQQWIVQGDIVVDHPFRGC